MKKQDLIDKVAKVERKTKSETEGLLDSFLLSIRNALVTGEEVTLHGFGKFSVATRAPREGRNPQTGKPMTVGGGRVVKFKPQKALKDAVAGKSA